MNSKYRSWRWFAALVVLGLLVAACGGSADPTTTTAGEGTTTTAGEPGDTTTTQPETPGNPGLDGCTDDPVNCNSGPRADGGDVVYLIDQPWDGWNTNRVEANSVYAVQSIEGINAIIGYYAPDGAWTWNMDVLAAEPTYENSVITYELNESAVWHNPDGTTTPISGDDFILGWKFTSGNPDHCLIGELDEETGLPLEGSEGCFPASTARSEDIVDITVEGQTVSVQFPDGYAYAEWHALWGGLAYPAHIAEAQGFDLDTPEGVADASTYFNNTVPDWSGGAYLIENATLGERVVMVPNPSYYGTDKATLETLTKEVVTDRGSWIPALTNRDIHGASPASFDVLMLEELDRLDDVTYGIGSGGAVWEHVDMNMETLADVELRKAIFTAIDREDARTRIYSPIEPTFRGNPIFPANDPNFFEDFMTPNGYGTGDVAAATAILEAAGYTGMDGGAGALTAPDGTTVPDVRFGFSAANTNRGTFVELTQSYLGEIGINVVPVPADNLGALLVGPDWDMVIFGWSGSPLFTSSANQFYNSASNSNFGGINNPQVDELVSGMLTAETLEEAAGLANEAMAIVMGDEAFTLTLWDTMNLSFMGTELVNMRDNNFDSTRAYYNTAQWGFLAN